MKILRYCTFEINLHFLFNNYNKLFQGFYNISYSPLAYIIQIMYVILDQVISPRQIISEQQKQGILFAALAAAIALDHVAYW